MTVLQQPSSAITLPQAAADAIRLFQESVKSGTVVLRFKEGRIMQVDKTVIDKM